MQFCLVITDEIVVVLYIGSCRNIHFLKIIFKSTHFCKGLVFLCVCRNDRDFLYSLNKPLVSV